MSYGLNITAPVALILMLSTASITPAHAFTLCWWCKTPATTLVDNRPALKAQPQSSKDFWIEIIGRSRTKGASEPEIKAMLDNLEQIYLRLGAVSGNVTLVRDTKTEGVFQTATKACEKAKPTVGIPKVACMTVTSVAAAIAIITAINEYLSEESYKKCPVEPVVDGSGEDEAEAGLSVDKEAQIETNAADGKRREEMMLGILRSIYQCDDIYRERYLRNATGVIVKDGRNEGRRIDFAVVSPKGIVLDAVEVTSPTANKDAQTAKEVAIKAKGGTYIRKPRTKTLYNAKLFLPARIERLP